jgi:pentose-5-phosphate-3-epimerase
MVREPQRFIDMFADIPQEMISYHAETGVHPRDITVPEGTLLGIAVNPDSPRLSPDILSSIDFVVVMGVHPGFGGAPFEASTYETVSWYDQYRGDRELPFEILVDGGVSRDIRALMQAGGVHFVVGRAFSSMIPSRLTASLRHYVMPYDGHKDPGIPVRHHPHRRPPHDDGGTVWTPVQLPFMCRDYRRSYP